MCTVKQSPAFARGIDARNDANKKVGTSSLDEALAMLDNADSALSDCSISSDSSDISEMAALIEAAVAEDVDKKKPQKIKLIKPDKNKAQILTPLIIPTDESSRKRLSRASLTPANGELAAKRAKISTALSIGPKAVERRRFTGSPPKRHFNNYLTTPLPVKKIAENSLPVAATPAGTLAGGRSSIHGRKMISIREQQEQMSKKDISEFVLRLKAEQEVEKTLKKPNRRQETGQQKRGIHAAAFGSLQSVSRLPFILDEEHSATDGKAA